jgi:paraquat-inducible protein B
MKIEHIIKRNNPYRYPSVMEKIKSFDTYAAEVKLKGAADQLLIDNLLMQLIEAKAGTALNDVTAKLDTLQDSLKPVSKFFANIQKTPAPSKMTKAEKEALENEEREKRLTALALKKMARKNR